MIDLVLSSFAFFDRDVDGSEVYLKLHRALKGPGSAVYDEYEEAIEAQVDYYFAQSKSSHPMIQRTAFVEITEEKPQHVAQAQAVCYMST